VAEVLNAHFENWFALNRGQVLEGVVLASGWGKLPEDVQSGTLQIRVTLTDDLDRETAVQMKLMVKRASVGTAAAPVGSAADSHADQEAKVDVADSRIAVRSAASTPSLKLVNQT